MTVANQARNLELQFRRAMQGLERAGGYTSSMLDSWECNRGSFLHSRVHGALARSFDEKHPVLIEPRPVSGYVPDIGVVNAGKHNGLETSYRYVVEYESSNSSDERVVIKDLAGFYRMVEASDKGNFSVDGCCFVVVTTLLDGPVSGLKWYGYNERYKESLSFGKYKVRAGPKGSSSAQPTKKSRASNPWEYYNLAFSDAMTESFKAMRAINKEVSLVWMNIGHRDHYPRIVWADGKKEI